MRVHRMRGRLRGLGDDSSSADANASANSVAQDVWVDPLGNTLSTGYEPITEADPSNSAIQQNVTDAYSFINADAQAIAAWWARQSFGLPNWVWLAGAGLLYLAWHHEFERGK